ncbi:hypothetical protein V6N13_022073 [Hibiscus sabdariffa]
MVYLLEIEDRLVYSSLKNFGWSYLKEVFTEVHPWSDSFKIPERVVWLELLGISLHCWNHQTYKRITKIWGKLLALGENALQSSGVERMTILVSTSQIEKIDTIIDVESERISIDPNHLQNQEVANGRNEPKLPHTHYPREVSTAEVVNCEAFSPSSRHTPARGKILAGCRCTREPASFNLVLFVEVRQCWFVSYRIAQRYDIAGMLVTFQRTL